MVKAYGLGPSTVRNRAASPELRDRFRGIGADILIDILGLQYRRVGGGLFKVRAAGAGVHDFVVGGGADADGSLEEVD